MAKKLIPFFFIFVFLLSSCSEKVEQDLSKEALQNESLLWVFSEPTLEGLQEGTGYWEVTQISVDEVVTHGVTASGFSTQYAGPAISAELSCQGLDCIYTIKWGKGADLEKVSELSRVLRGINVHFKTLYRLNGAVPGVRFGRDGREVLNNSFPEKLKNTGFVILCFDGDH